MKTEGLVRKYRVRKIKYKYIKAVLKPGELIEIDVKYMPVWGLFQEVCMSKIE